MHMKSILSFHSVHDNLKDVSPVLEFAQKNDVHLDMVILAPFVRPIVSADGMIMNDTTFASNKILSEKGHHQKEQILKLGDRQGISMSVVVEVADVVQFGNILASYANCADCLVLDRVLTLHHDVTARSFAKILMDVNCPTLLLSGSGPKLSEIGKVLVAWDGGVTAATAIRHALPTLQMAKNTLLLSVDPSTNKEGEVPGDDMALFLARHDINVTVELIPSAGNSISTALIQKAEDVDADLTVMGGYGRSRLSEWILGGTTKEMLSNAKRSVFMAHG
jgi:nucleotide-binding universal stress UspA family protein